LYKLFSSYSIWQELQLPRFQHSTCHFANVMTVLLSSDFNQQLSEPQNTSSSRYH